MNYRSDGWTDREDRVVIREVTNARVKGLSINHAFRTAAKELNRPFGGCSNRWYQFIRPKRNVKNLEESGGMPEPELLKLLNLKVAEEKSTESILEHCESYAKQKYQGHFTMMRFSTEWRFSFGTVLERDGVATMATGKTMEEAMQNALIQEVATVIKPIVSNFNESMREKLLELIKAS